MIHLKINPPHANADTGESPFLVTHNIKNRSTLVLYKVMIRKGLQTLKNEQSTSKKNEINESTDPTGAEPTQKKKPKKRFMHSTINNVFATQSQSTQELEHEKKNRASLSPSHEEPPTRQAKDHQSFAKEAQNKIDENFVKTKFDSMCG